MLLLLLDRATSNSKSTDTKSSDPVTIESSSELAKRAFALGKYEDAVEFYATALELMYASSSA